MSDYEYEDDSSISSPTPNEGSFSGDDSCANSEGLTDESLSIGGHPGSSDPSEQCLSTDDRSPSPDDSDDDSEAGSTTSSISSVSTVTTPHNLMLEPWLMEATRLVKTVNLASSPEKRALELFNHAQDVTPSPMDYNDEYATIRDLILYYACYYRHSQENLAKVVKELETLIRATYHNPDDPDETGGDSFAAVLILELEPYIGPCEYVGTPLEGTCGCPPSNGVFSFVVRRRSVINHLRFVGFLHKERVISGDLVFNYAAAEVLYPQAAFACTRDTQILAFNGVAEMVLEILWENGVHWDDENPVKRDENTLRKWMKGEDFLSGIEQDRERLLEVRGVARRIRRVMVAIRENDTGEEPAERITKEPFLIQYVI